MKIFESRNHKFLITKHVLEIIKKAQATSQCSPHSLSVRSRLIEHKSISFAYSLAFRFRLNWGDTITIFSGLHKAKTLFISQSANSFIRNYARRFIFDSRGWTQASLIVMQFICFCVCFCFLAVFVGQINQQKQVGRIKCTDLN